MAGELTQAIQKAVLSSERSAAIAAVVLGCTFLGVPARSTVLAAPPLERPRPSEGVAVDPIAGGYDPWAYHPGTSPAAIRPGTSSAHHSRKNPPPTYCKEAAAGLVVVPSAVLAGTPVDCGPGRTETPAELAQRAWHLLRLPLPDVHTAPPRGSAGLVGLPEWVWVPRDQWAPRSRLASAGGSWAQVTATPKRLVIHPGAGLPGVTCDGPGTAYDQALPASVQHTDCSSTYARSSAAAPGAAYRMRVTVVWGGVWTGSDGTGGPLPDISRSTAFPVRVAEGQGLYG